MGFTLFPYLLCQTSPHNQPSKPKEKQKGSQETFLAAPRLLCCNYKIYTVGGGSGGALSIVSAFTKQSDAIQ